MEVTTKVNYDYTVSCLDSRGRELRFRDITGLDLEYLDTIFDNEDRMISGKQISQILEYLSVSPLSAGRLTPRVIKSLYSALTEHILSNYMTKETWLKQCYSIQNGSFQGVRDMETVPLSKFTAMCMIHKEAMDQIKNENDPIQ